MPNSKRSARRAQLFSLSARMERRASARPELEIRSVASHDDDGCPICVAMRSGGLDIETYLARFSPGLDGSPPQLDPDYVIEEASKALAQRKPRVDEALPFMQFGRMHPDGTFAQSAYTIDGAGRLFWKSPTQHALVAQLPVNGYANAPQV